MKKSIKPAPIMPDAEKIPATPLKPWQQYQQTALQSGQWVSDKDAKEAVRRINTYTSFTKSLLKEFTTVKLYMVNNVLYFHYYKGRGKTMQEGKCTMLTDAIDTLTLLPQLEAVYGSTIKKQVRRTAVQIEAATATEINNVA